MPSLTLPLAWSTLPPISVDLSPPSLPASSLTLPLAWSHLPSILSSIRLPPWFTPCVAPPKYGQMRCHGRPGEVGAMSVLSRRGVGRDLTPACPPLSSRG